MRTLATLFLVIALLVCVTELQAATFNKIQTDENPADSTYDTGTWLWTTFDNWQTSTGDATSVGPPADGDEIRFYRNTSVTGGRGAWRACIDTNGATLNLPSSAMIGNYNGENYGIYDSTHFTPIYQTSPTLNTIPSDNNAFTQLSAATPELEAASSPAMTVASLSLSKQNYFSMYMPLNVEGNYKINGSGMTLFGPTAIDGDMNLEGRDDANSPIVGRNTLSVAGTTTVADRAQLTLMDDAAFDSIIIADKAPESNLGRQNFLRVEGGEMTATSIDISLGRMIVDGTGPTSISVSGDMSVGDASLTGAAGEYSDLQFIFDSSGVTPINISGSLDLDALSTLTVDTSAYSVPGGDDLVTLMEFEGGYGNLALFALESFPSALPGGYGIQYLPTSIVLSNFDASAQAVPEPSTFALAALGLVGLGWFGWRRRK